MSCKHLQELFKLCQDNEIRLGSSDLVRVVCQQCDEKEVCPSTLMDEYDSRHAAKTERDREQRERARGE